MRVSLLIRREYESANPEPGAKCHRFLYIEGQSPCVRADAGARRGSYK
jgi:hypothetical protein